MNNQLKELQTNVETVLDAWCPTAKGKEEPHVRMMRALLHVNAFMLDAKRSLAGERPIRTDYPVPLPTKIS